MERAGQRRVRSGANDAMPLLAAATTLIVAKIRDGSLSLRPLRARPDDAQRFVVRAINQAGHAVDAVQKPERLPSGPSGLSIPLKGSRWAS